MLNHVRLYGERLARLKVGDRVTRLLAGEVPMSLTVTKIDGLVHCGPWTFHRETGCEVDEVLGWDGVERTGSFLVAEDAP